MGKFLFIMGLLGAAFTLGYDKIVGKPENLGPKSYVALAICAVLILVGLISWRKGPSAVPSEGGEEKQE